MNLLTEWVIWPQWVEKNVICCHLKSVLLFLKCFRWLDQALDQRWSRLSVIHILWSICSRVSSIKQVVGSLIVLITNLRNLSILSFFANFTIQLNFWSSWATLRSPVGKVTELHIGVENFHWWCYQEKKNVRYKIFKIGS